MQITLKKTLIAGVGLLAAVFFFLVAFMPVSRTVTTVLGSETVTGSLMGVLSGDEQSLYMVASQIKVETTSASALKAWETAVEVLQNVYKVFGVMSIVLFVMSALACVGAFFLKTPRGARKLSIPFLAIDIALSLVVMIFAIVMTASTEAIKGVEITTSVLGPVIMYLLGIAAFVGMLVSAGVVKEVVFVGKKEEK